MGMAASRYRNKWEVAQRQKSLAGWLYLAAPTSEWGHWFAGNAKALANKEKNKPSGMA